MSGDQDDTRAVGPLVRRLRAFLVVSVAATVLAVAALVASLWVKSPGQRAAEQSPPPPSVLTATVTAKVLMRTTTVRGSVTASEVTAVAPSSAAGTRRVVTSLLTSSGEPVKPGSALGTVGGRPVFVLPGTVPMYRDILPATTGADVRQVQQGLKDLGLYSGEVTGTFSTGTQSAVADWYRLQGMEAMTMTDVEPSLTGELQAAEDARVQADRVLSRARSAAAAATPETKKAAEQSVTYAREDLATAQTRLATVRARAGVVIPAGELVFVRFPASVGTVAATVGTDLATAQSPVLLSILSEPLLVSGQASASQRQGLAVHQSATVTDETTGESRPGTLTSIGELVPASTTAATGVTPAGHPFVISPDESLPTTWAGRSVRVQVVVAQTPTAVLVVPLAAIRTRVDQSTIVVVVRGDQQTETVVSTGLVSTGEVEVHGDDLAEGDQVLVS